LEDFLTKRDWDVKAIQNAAKNVEFENTVTLGLGKKYSRLPVSPGAYMFPAWDMNHSYAETGVFVSIGKPKNHLAIIDGMESIAGAELPRAGTKPATKPGVLLAGFNPVCTDAVGAAVMGYNPQAVRGEPGFPRCDNTLVLGEQRGIGSTDLKRIEVRGVPIEKALYSYEDAKAKAAAPRLAG
jgi:hypothetical protein